MFAKRTFIEHIFTYLGVDVDILRLDKQHPLIQGNKFYKLKYQLIEAKDKHLPVVTVGGAFSNHLHATAIACKQLKIPSHGIVRGQNFKKQSPTLSNVIENGMNIHFVDRLSYKEIRQLYNHNDAKLALKESIDRLPKDFIFVPEGGTNEKGVQGASEILQDIKLSNYDIVICPVGSGGTMAGLIRATANKSKVLGIACVKDTSLDKTIQSYLSPATQNWSLNFDYTFKGFGKWNTELIEFINSFYAKYKIPLDPIYTSKMLYGIQDLIKKNQFEKNSKILAVHTGGLQGIEGFNMMNNHIINV